MSTTYGWYSPSRAAAGGRVFVYESRDGQTEVLLTEATSRADYRPPAQDSTSLGPVGRFLRSVPVDKHAHAKFVSPVESQVPVASTAPPEPSEASDDLDDLIDSLTGA